MIIPTASAEWLPCVFLRTQPRHGDRVEDIDHAAEEGVRTLVLEAELGVRGCSVGRWDPTKGWPEASFAPCIGQKVCVKRCVCVCVCVCVCWGSIQCILYIGPQPFSLTTSTNLSFSS